MILCASLFGLYGKYAGNVIKTGMRKTESICEMEVDLSGFQKGEISVQTCRTAI